MDVYRITKCKYIHDLSGVGSALYGGRWNSKGVYLLYAAETPSLALLESIAHMTGLPLEDFCFAKINIPDIHIAEIKGTELPVGWSGYPPPGNLKSIGDQFIRNNIFLALKIPSALMPEEHIILLNPFHPDFSKVQTVTVRSLSIDERLIKLPGKAG
jgi:RES domain-containing protein